MSTMQRISEAGVIDAVRQWRTQNNHIRAPAIFARSDWPPCFAKPTQLIGKPTGGQTVWPRSSDDRG